MFRRWTLVAGVMAIAACSADTAATTPVADPVVSLSLDSVSMRAGDSVVPSVQVTIDGTTRPALASEITISSSDTSVVAVASNDALLGLTDGTATISVAWVATPTVAATGTVTVASESLTGVNLTAPLSMVPGDTATFTVTGTTRFGREVSQPASVTVTSRNNAVVTAIGDIVVAIAPGTTWIVALASTGASDSSLVTVAVGAPASLVLTPHIDSLIVGRTVQTSVAVADRRGNAITATTPAYGSTSTAVATVTGDGLVTAHAAGTAMIVARSGAAADTLRLTVINDTTPVALGSLRATPATLSLNPGDTARVAVAAFDTHGNVMPLPPLTWESFINGVSVSSTGLISVSSSIAGSVTNGVVQVSAGSTVVQIQVSVTVVPPPPPSSDTGYVQIVWIGTMPSPSVAAAFEAARQRINGLFNSFNGVTPVNPRTSAGYCLAGTPAWNQTVNGIVIFAQVTTIDGVGNILGSAGPCLLRNGTLLPIVATMKFDSADMAAMVNNGSLNGVVLHEMMHTLGFGTIWQPAFQDEVASPNGSDPRYSGATGVAEYAALGAADAASGVPVENTGGTGTRGAHWRESVFNGELMTGWANGSMAMSRVTIGALKDFGYDVNLNKADPYTLGAALMAGESNASQEIVETMIRPIGVMGNDGTVVPYRH